ncbi:bifunctional 2-C-methyl-D-erythritol 4-phosphate cytidylyltransferase/2-C-methyl-D-erythritol 2,4-cyclodiphosphate synthase [Terricaulis silvestris]|uniref:Bifunctional enzyme IspD/IspF n=1 Tax=Terricaulis silvestris TaxID=2686094 RepID=A0A6I6MKF0_9CAUL|nr:bifunctional 2-C-methyl-D-erythritol 4-phosphate cytidylyltransferase/2-C-methyl-D-erythritol 2,4-cyclodiphosphate synthase [Terricaulis silvestris]QGZ95149.1 Bifunctional enzyme IspD/IspF [Terricaulis silvestris]
MKAAALIVAAGRGERLGSDTPKQYRRLRGRPVLSWSVEAVAAAGIEQIVIAIAPEHAELCRNATKGGPAVRIVEGGASRTASVRAGLAAIADAEAILIHDAARPGLSPSTVTALLAALASADGAAPALPVADSLRRIDADRRVIGEVERDGLMRVQTPQAFRADMLRAAYAALGDQVMSDDLAVVRAGGGRCVLILGDPRLMKLTYAEDFAVLDRLMGERVTCVGNGIDAHRFGPGEFVTLCGVRIPHDKGLVGHSDADAGWHALVDAILGALGEGDIGAHFPPSDPQWKGADSERFLRHAVQLADAAGARILHVDVTLICEKPKIGPHRDAMRQRTAAVLGLPLERVSVKATTTERMGFLGREEGLAAQATATLDRPL